MKMHIYSIALAALLAAPVAFAETSTVEEKHDDFKVHKTDKVIREAETAGARMEAPFELAVAKQFYNAATMEKDDEQSRIKFFDAARKYADMARRKTTEHVTSTFQREWLIDPATPSGKDQYRKDLEEIQQRFFSFRPQVAKYALPAPAAEVFVGIQQLNDNISEDADNSAIEHQIALLKSRLEELEQYDLPEVEFKGNTALLKDEEQPILRFVHLALQETPELMLAVTGHTETSRSHNRNVAMAQKRADTIKAWLIARGVNPSRVVTVATGEAVPTMTHDLRVSRGQQHRVEFWDAL